MLWLSFLLHFAGKNQPSIMLQHVEIIPQKCHRVWHYYFGITFWKRTKKDERISQESPFLMLFLSNLLKSYYFEFSYILYSWQRYFQIIIEGYIDRFTESYCIWNMNCVEMIIGCIIIFLEKKHYISKNILIHAINHYVNGD